MSQPIISECKGCGEPFYGYAYMGEPCSQECADKLRNPEAIS